MFPKEKAYSTKMKKSEMSLQQVSREGTNSPVVGRERKII